MILAAAKLLVDLFGCLANWGRHEARDNDSARQDRIYDVVRRINALQVCGTETKLVHEQPR